MSTPSNEELFEFLNEFAFWYQNMARKGELPRAISGVNARGEQFVLRLDGITLEHSQRHALIRTILLEEGTVFYAYGGVLKHAKEGTDQVNLIVATANYYLIGSFNIEQNETLHLEQVDFWEGDNPAEIPSAWFLTDTIQVSDGEKQRYSEIWKELRLQAMFLQRPMS